MTEINESALSRIAEALGPQVTEDFLRASTCLAQAATTLNIGAVEMDDLVQVPALREHIMAGRAFDVTEALTQLKDVPAIKARIATAKAEDRTSRDLAAELLALPPAARLSAARRMGLGAPAAPGAKIRQAGRPAQPSTPTSDAIASMPANTTEQAVRKLNAARKAGLA